MTSLTENLAKELEETILNRDTMAVDKKSPCYMKSSYERSLYGNDDYTTFEREFKVKGNDKEEVRTAAPWIQRDVMP